MSLPRRAARGGIDARHLGGERGAALLDELACRARLQRGARVLLLEALLVGCTRSWGYRVRVRVRVRVRLRVRLRLRVSSQLLRV